MTAETENGNKLQRTRKRVYESAEPADLAAASAEPAAVETGAAGAETAASSVEAAVDAAADAADVTDAAVDAAVDVTADADADAAKKVDADADPGADCKVVATIDADAAGSVDAIADPDAERCAESMAVVKRYSLLAAGAGVVPVPLLDMAAMLAVQMSMVKKLAGLYGTPYAEQRSKAAVAGLIGGANAGYIGGSALKMFPILGIFSLAAMPAVNAAITYAVGKVFIQHFASGGTFLNFDPEQVRDYYRAQLEESRKRG